MHFQDLVTLLRGQLESKAFSFLDYGSYQSLVPLALASKYTNSTFVTLIDNDPSLAEKLHQSIQTRNLKNVALTNITIDASIVNKLVESPEFLRYQLLGELISLI